MLLPQQRANSDSWGKVTEYYMESLKVRCTKERMPDKIIVDVFTEIVSCLVIQML